MNRRLNEDFSFDFITNQIEKIKFVRNEVFNDNTDFSLEFEETVELNDIVNNEPITPSQPIQPSTDNKWIVTDEKMRGHYFNGIGYQEEPIFVDRKWEPWEFGLYKMYSTKHGDKLFTTDLHGDIRIWNIETIVYHILKKLYEYDKSKFTMDELYYYNEEFLQVNLDYIWEHIKSRYIIFYKNYYESTLSSEEEYKNFFKNNYLDCIESFRQPFEDRYTVKREYDEYRIYVDGWEHTESTLISIDNYPEYITYIPGSGSMVIDERCLEFYNPDFIEKYNPNKIITKENYQERFTYFRIYSASNFNEGVDYPIKISIDIDNDYTANFNCRVTNFKYNRIFKLTKDYFNDYYTEVTEIEITDESDDFHFWGSDDFIRRMKEEYNSKLQRFKINN